MTNDVNKDLEKEIKEEVARIVKEGSTVYPETAVAVIDPNSVKLPKGVSIDSINNHIDLFTKLGLITEMVNNEIALTEGEKDDNITSYQTNLELGKLKISSKHYLKQEFDNEAVYGESITIIDYQHDPDFALIRKLSEESIKDRVTEMFNRKTKGKDTKAA